MLARIELVEMPVSRLSRSSGQARSTRLMLAQGRPSTLCISFPIRVSTRFKAADDEIAAWIRARWQFRPNITHTFTLPVTVIVPATHEDKPPLKLSEADLARLKNGEKRELLLSLGVDHGQITKISILHSTGDSKLDAAAARWIKDNWVFNPAQSGLFNMPVVFSKAKEAKEQ